jgi:hypothetical protein
VPFRQNLVEWLVASPASGEWRFTESAGIADVEQTGRGSTSKRQMLDRSGVERDSVIRVLEAPRRLCPKPVVGPKEQLHADVGVDRKPLHV